MLWLQFGVYTITVFLLGAMAVAKIIDGRRYSWTQAACTPCRRASMSSTASNAVSAPRG